MPDVTFNNRLRQVLLIGLIHFLTIVFINQLYIFLSGILGGITLYIITRKLYLRLTLKWSRRLTALLFIIGSLIIIAIPVYFTVLMVSP